MRARLVPGPQLLPDQAGWASTLMTLRGDSDHTATPPAPTCCAQDSSQQPPLPNWGPHDEAEGLLYFQKTSVHFKMF